MSYLDSLYSERNRYEGLKSDVNSIIAKLADIASDLNTPITNLDNSFKIDNISLGANKISSIKNSLESRSEHLSNNVIPSINGEISSINEKINAEEERIRREEEEREKERLEALEKEKTESTNGGSK